MRQHRWQVVAAVLASALMIGAYDAVSYAANGDSLVLGRLNKATKITTLERSTQGAALKLDTKAVSPPLAVTSKVKVKRLNADRVDGFDARQLASNVVTFTNAFPSGVAYPDRDWRLVVAPGVYRVDINGAFLPAESSTPSTMYCGIQSYLTADHTGGRIEVAQTAPFQASPVGRAEISATRVFRVLANRDYYFYCVPDQGEFEFWDIHPLTVQFTSVTSMKSGGDLQPWTP